MSSVEQWFTYLWYEEALDVYGILEDLTRGVHHQLRTISRKRAEAA